MEKNLAMIRLIKPVMAVQRRKKQTERNLSLSQKANNLRNPRRRKSERKT